jgi:hypothetical protein
MASAAREQSAGLKSASFTLYQAPLTVTESIALECVRQIAREQRQATNAEICAAIGSENYEGGTAPGVLRRLEEKGYVSRTMYQRGFQVRIVATGEQTAPPRNTAPHWRTRSDHPPAPAIQAIRERAKPIAAMIEAEARMSGKHHADFLADLVYIGWHQYQAEKERGE